MTVEQSFLALVRAGIGHPMPLLKSMGFLLLCGMLWIPLCARMLCPEVVRFRSN